MSILPILLALSSVNHRFPSGPAAIDSGALPTGNSPRIAPPALNFPILLEPPSVNQRFRSGPTTIDSGPLPGGRGISRRRTPAGDICAILLEASSTSQTFPSGPATIPCGFPKTAGNS